jgi:uncharacterized membrane protein YhhN
MKNLSSSVLSLFGILSAANLLAIAMQSAWGIYLTKPLLLTSLSLWFYLQTRHRQTPFTRAMLAGLIFSIAGDTFLMLNREGAEQFFLYGLGSFLVAHLCYITAFLKYPYLKNGLVAKNIWLVLPFVLFLAWFSWFLWSSLPPVFKIPVVVYATVIVTMAVTCLNMKGRIAEKAFQLLFTGALLFVLSDSLIALTSFKYPDFSEIPARLSIMITYLAGQCLIAKGGELVGIEL